jgi:hypothetical protein
MPSEIVKKEIVPGHAIERISIMDDYGAEHVLQIPVTWTKAGARQHKIDSTLAEHDAREAAFESYANENGYTAQLAVLRSLGQLKKAKAKQ